MDTGSEPQQDNPFLVELAESERFLWLIFLRPASLVLVNSNSGGGELDGGPFVLVAGTESIKRSPLGSTNTKVWVGSEALFGSSAESLKGILKLRSYGESKKRP